MSQLMMWFRIGTETRKPLILPDGVVLNILSRLPVKSLVRFRCVCKDWNSLIQDPTFVNFHLERSKDIYVNYFCSVSVRDGSKTKEFSMFYSFHRNDLTVSICRNSNLSLHMYDTIASCDGLLCTGKATYGGEGYRVQVHNTGLNELLRVTLDYNHLLSRYPAVARLGIGFDSILKKYKVVFWNSESGSKAMIITLGEKSWRPINNWSADKHVLSSKASREAVYLEGASHWCTAAGILSFNFKEEKFGVIPFPEYMFSDYTFCEIHVMEDQLCLMDERKDVAVLNMWLLVDYYKYEWVHKQIHLKCRDSVGEVVPIREGEIMIDKDHMGKGELYHCRYDEEGYIINSTKTPEIPHAHEQRVRRQRCILCAESLVSMKQIDGRCKPYEQPKVKTIPSWHKWRQLNFY